MNHYDIWVNLAPGVNDLEFVAALNAYLGFLRDRGTCESWQIRRRKFGFGPPGLGEFSISIQFRELGQMDEAFLIAATRAPEVEALHRAVFERVTDYSSALYRDFPDAVRQTE